MRHFLGRVLFILGILILWPLQIGLSIYGIYYVVKTFLNAGVIAGLISIPITGLCLGAIHMLITLISTPLAGLVVSLLEEKKQEPSLQELDYQEAPKAGDTESERHIVYLRQRAKDAEAERFILNLFEEGITDGFHEQGAKAGYSRATISKALENLLQTGKIKRIYGIYSLPTHGVSSVTRAEYLILEVMGEELHTSAEFNKQGKAMGYSEATIGKALSNLVETRKIKKITRGVYSIAGEATETPIGETQPTLTMPLEIEEERKKQSNTFGIWSLVLGIIGIFAGPVAIAAIVLGALQFKRHVSKCSIAGLVLGIIGTILWVVGLGYQPLYTPKVSPL